MTAVLKHESTVSLTASNLVTNTSGGWYIDDRYYVADPNTHWVQSPPFAPVQEGPFNGLNGLEALGKIVDYTVPDHNYESHCDILGSPVGCKHCPYANVHKLDPASHPFMIYEEA